MDTKELLKKVESLPVEQLSVQRFGKTFQVYPWIKARLFTKVMMGTEVLKEKDRETLFQQLRSLGYGFFSFFRKYDAWVLTSSSERIFLNGTYTDKLFDYIGNETGLKTLIIELQLFKKFHRQEVASKHVVSRAWLIFLEELYARLFLRSVNVQGEELLQEVESVMGVSVDTKAIVRKYLAQYRVMRFLVKILPKPKVVFLSVSYANYGYIRAWKEAGIKVVEMQHGLIGDGHSGYTYHAAFAADQFPDEIIVFGETDRLFFEQQTSIPIPSVKALGTYVIDYFRERATENKVPVKRILVSLQDMHWSTALIDFVLRCNELTNGKLEWIIQPRRTPESHYRELYQFPENVRFSEQSVYAAMAESDAHLTIFSTTAVESLSIGKPTFLYNFDNAAHTYLDLFLKDQPNVYFCDNEQDFVTSLEALKYVSKAEIASSNNRNNVAGYRENMNRYITALHHEFAEK